MNLTFLLDVLVAVAPGMLVIFRTVLIARIVATAVVLVAEIVDVALVAADVVVVEDAEVENQALR